VEQVVADGLQPAPAAILVPPAELEARTTPGLSNTAKSASTAGEISRMQKLVDVTPDVLLRTVAYSEGHKY
jgi:hypothetical protein